MIIYYPLSEYKQCLKRKTPFTLLNKIRVPGARGNKGKFLQ